MIKWMKKTNVHRYEEGIRRYLEEKGNVEHLVSFDWGFKAHVAIMDEENKEYDTHYYTLEYQGKDQFSVHYSYIDWENAPEDDFGEDIEVHGGFIHVK